MVSSPPKNGPVAEATSSARADRPQRAALAQVAPILGDRQANLEMHLEQIDRARRLDADLLIFPELSLTGYFLRDMVPDLALGADAPELARLAQAAGSMGIVVGFVEEGDDNRFYNSVFYASDGELLHVHRKVYLPTYGLFDEGRYFARGRRLRAFRFSTAQGAWRRGGLLVCEDFWHLSAVAVMQAEGVDLLICVANSPARGVTGENVDTADTYERLCKTYAQLLGAVVVLVNRVGFEDGLCFWGGSMVAAPDARIIARAPMFDPALCLATIDPLDIRRERLLAPLARDERLLLTIEELNRIKRHEYED